MKVTIFKNIFDKQAPHHINLSQALSRIQTGSSSSLITQIRESEKKQQSELKKSLPVVCFSGEFSSRADDALFEHSGYVVLDFDQVDPAQAKQALGTDDYIHAVWVSPSGKGVKALVHITNPERHRDHFRAMVKYFHKQYGLELDESGINESRACYESYDPDIIVKTSQRFGAMLSEKAELGQTVQREGIVTDYMKLNLAARMVRMAEDGDKHNQLLKAARLCGGYIAAGRIEEDEAARVLLREIMRRDIESESHAIHTIREGIEKGKNDPIREVIGTEQDVQREMLLNDGDMSFISSDDEDFRWIDDYANGKIALGLETGNTLIDQYFRYKKEFLIVNGHSNVGKTTMMLYLMVNASVRHKWKWVVYSSENKTASVKMKLMEFLTDKKVGDMTYLERKNAYQWINEYFTVISNNQVYSYSDIILFMEKVMRQQDVDAIFIDPYNSLKLDIGSNGINTHDYHYQAASEFLTFSNVHNVAIWLNMHAVTEAQRRKGDDGLPVAPFAEDTEGGGKFVNRADCFLTIHRKVQAPDPHTRNLTEMHVRKVREVETGGQPTPYGEPIKFTINLSHTGFREWNSQTNLFQKTDTQEVKQSSFKLYSNLDFLGNTV
jgi:replicative DNA helicase